MIIRLHLALSKMTQVVFVQRILGSKEHTAAKNHSKLPGHMITGWSAKLAIPYKGTIAYQPTYVQPSRLNNWVLFHIRRSQSPFNKSSMKIFIIHKNLQPYKKSKRVYIMPIVTDTIS